MAGFDVWKVIVAELLVMFTTWTFVIERDVVVGGGGGGGGVGEGGGGEIVVTVIVALCVAVPPLPVQDKV